MCERGDTKVITVSQTFAADACLAEEILLLNGRGVRTHNSCCQHGQGQPFINTYDIAVAEALGYEVREGENGVGYLIPRGTDWGMAAPPYWRGPFAVPD